MSADTSNPATLPDLPWVNCIYDDEDPSFGDVVDCNLNAIVFSNPLIRACVVRAVNSHDALVAALEALVGKDVSYLGSSIKIEANNHSDAIARIRTARAALLLAKGGFD